MDKIIPLMAMDPNPDGISGAEPAYAGLISKVIINSKNNIELVAIGNHPYFFFSLKLFIAVANRTIPLITNGPIPAGISGAPSVAYEG